MEAKSLELKSFRKSDYGLKLTLLLFVLLHLSPVGTGEGTFPSLNPTNFCRLNPEPTSPSAGILLSCWLRTLSRGIGLSELFGFLEHGTLRSRASVEASLTSIHINCHSQLLFESFLNGSLPVLPRLKSLQVSHCKIRSLDSVPGTLGTLRSLTIQSHNREWPGGIFSLQLREGSLEPFPTLNSLDLSLNNIRETLPPSFLCPVDSVLRSLNLSRNDLGPVLGPFDCGSSLRILDLSHNSLESLSPGALKALKNLVLLDLSRNRLGALEPTFLGFGHNLRQLFLDHNQLSSLPGKDTFANCSGIQDLGLAGNRLEEVPDALLLLRSLQTLDLGENRIRGFSSAGTFAGLRSLYGLRLVDNRLTSLPSAFCAPLRSLRVLNLAQNRILNIEPDSLSGCPELRALRLDSNQLEALPTSLLAQSHALLWLNLSTNSLSGNLDLALNLPPSVEWLDLSHNQLNVLGGWSAYGVGAPPSLRVLDASNNRLSSIGPEIVPPSLESLRVSHNDLQVVIPGTFTPGSRLRRIELSWNPNLRTLPISTISLPAPVPELVLAGLHLNCDCNTDWLSRVIDPESLTCQLNFTGTAIRASEVTSDQLLCPYSSHCFATCGCCEFEACDCAMACPSECNCARDGSWRSNIVQCSGKGLAALPARIPMDVTSLFLDGNQLGDSLGPHVFIGKKGLKSLYLNSSGITLLRNRTFNGLKALEVLRLDGNSLSQLEGHEFFDLESLRELYLQKNQLTILGEGTFQNLRALEVLRLDGNLLTNILTNIFPSTLRDLTLEANPWRCDCTFVETLRSWVEDQGQNLQSDLSVTNCEGGEDAGQTLEWACRESDSYPDLRSNSVSGPMEKKRAVEDKDQPPVVVQMVKEDWGLGLVLALLVVGLILFILCFLIGARKIPFMKSKLSPECCDCDPFGPFTPNGSLDKVSEKYAGGHLTRVTGPMDAPLFDAYFYYSRKDEESGLLGSLTSELEFGFGYRFCLHHRDLEGRDGLGGRGQGHLAALRAADVSLRVVLLLTQNLLEEELTVATLLTSRRVAKKTLVVLVPPVALNGAEALGGLEPSQVLDWGDPEFWNKFRRGLPTPPNQGFPSSSPRMSPPSLPLNPGTLLLARNNSLPVSKFGWASPGSSSDSSGTLPVSRARGHHQPARVYPVPTFGDSFKAHLRAGQGQHPGHQGQRPVPLPPPNLNFECGSPLLPRSSEDDDDDLLLTDHVYSSLDPPSDHPNKLNLSPRFNYNNCDYTLSRKNRNTQNQGNQDNPVEKGQRAPTGDFGHDPEKGSNSSPTTPNKRTMYFV